MMMAMISRGMQNIVQKVADFHELLVTSRSHGSLIPGSLVLESTVYNNQLSPCPFI